MHALTTCLLAVAIIVGAILIGGVYQVVVAPGLALSPTGGTIYVVNRFTGSVRFCSSDFCRPLSETALPPAQ
jgi:hypothetical protein